jgi:hypothetical protein
MLRPTINVLTTIYTDADARNWLTIRDCVLSPNNLGGMEVIFTSEQQKLEFCLRFAEYVINTVNPR